MHVCIKYLFMDYFYITTFRLNEKKGTGFYKTMFPFFVNC
jgi:hypothetical protein